MPLNANRHLSEDEIERFSTGSTSEEESPFVEEHLLRCESCRQLVEENDRYVFFMKRASAQVRNNGAK